ncbi:hypothetical protein [Aneurinibacillus aneurinilyticus]|jgi:hypothetical protein|uniref:Uncharacterized protein n=1 Tax=Aneurinibacillus aneurinilyticus ATCC 12856 TaxID=649747 RepID=U1YD37_ANEAE|nr:hypothetical protein [Aneurinibacillus aneurinilyticus]ERI10012.1 hypothetical protein HMPREF0083_01945 [Aneurinibacillus aneurinilyticus ATCC 12856]MCI1692600.1 hypothetical protein [Aneurinibacillus aneurinilyticus]MED0705140.1 hypothetical protein [Aneurinibacillus aneurinilyticus]MED0725636.1 hypothetical protein [Aneurinibacillus aneurinilyticus]MED0733840.1 hypothetical protein [Aneurinibacillus aneurinilyticus]
MNNNNDNRNHNDKEAQNKCIQNTAVPNFDAAKKTGTEFEHMKSNEELRKEGLLEDPIQETKEHAEQAADKRSNVKLVRAEEEK